MRHTRTRPGDMYISTTVVVMTELVKTLVCLFLAYKDEGYDLKKWLNHLHANIIQVEGAYVRSQVMQTLKHWNEILVITINKSLSLLHNINHAVLQNLLHFI